MSNSDNASVDSYDPDEKELETEIEHFLEGYTSDGVERSENYICMDQSDDDLLRKIDAFNSEVNNRASTDHNGIEFVGKKSAVFHLLNDDEEYGIYEHNPNEMNCEVFYRPGQPNYSVKQEPKNDDDTSTTEMGSSCFPYDNSQVQPNCSIKQEPENDDFTSNHCSTNEIGNSHFSYENSQEVVPSKEKSTDQFTNYITTSDIFNTMATKNNFSFSFNKMNVFQSSIFPQNNENQRCHDLRNVSNSKIRIPKQYENYSTGPGKIPSSFKNSRTQNFRRYKRNQNDIHTSSEKDKTIFKNPYQYNPQHNCSYFPSDNIDPSKCFSFTQPNNFNSQSNKIDYKKVWRPPKETLEKNLFQNEMPYTRNNESKKYINTETDKTDLQNFQEPYNLPSLSTYHPPKEAIYGSHPLLNSYDPSRQIQNKQQFNLPDKKTNQFVNLPHIGNQQHFEFLRDDNKQYFDLPHYDNNQDLNLPHHENQQNSSSMPIRQVSNVLFPEIYFDNDKVISKSQETNKDTKNNSDCVLHHIIKDYLCPVSVVGSTIKFTSRKLANTGVRDELILALTTYGTLANSWWTTDDVFFATYTSRSNAQRVFKLYPKNSSSSY